jgi:hypothetical protein
MRSQIVICVVVLLGCATSSAAQTVSLQFDNGLVTLNAQNAPVRTILAEWSRLGGTRFQNAERIGGAPVTLELASMPERQALEILLRSVAGYVATQREGGVSRLGGVVILPTSAAVRAPAPVTFGAATVQQQPQQQQLQRGLGDALNDANVDDRQGQRIPAPANPFAAPPGTTPVPGTIRVVTPPPANAPFGSVTPQEPPPATPGSPTVIRPPTPTPQVPVGTSRPGEITPQPQPQPQQPQR